MSPSPLTEEQQIQREIARILSEIVSEPDYPRSSEEDKFLKNLRERKSVGYSFTRDDIRSIYRISAKITEFRVQNTYK